MVFFLTSDRMVRILSSPLPRHLHTAFRYLSTSSKGKFAFVLFTVNLASLHAFLSFSVLLLVFWWVCFWFSFPWVAILWLLNFSQSPWTWNAVSTQASHSLPDQWYSTSLPKERSSGTAESSSRCCCPSFLCHTAWWNTRKSTESYQGVGYLGKS